MWEKEVRERFERIEATLEQVAEQQKQFRQDMIELDGMQRNTAALLDRSVEESRKRGAEIDERIANLTILVDLLVKKNLNGGH